MVASKPKRATSRSRRKTKDETLFDMGAVSAPQKGHGKAYDPLWEQYEREGKQSAGGVGETIAPVVWGDRPEPESRSSDSNADTATIEPQQASEGSEAERSGVSLVSELKQGDRVRGRTLSGDEVVGVFQNFTASRMLMLDVEGKRKMVDPATAAIELLTCDTCQHQQRHQVAEGEAFDCKLDHIKGVMCGGIVAQSMPQSCGSYETAIEPEPKPEPQISFEEGDRVKAQALNGVWREGIITRLGRTYAALDNGRCNIQLGSAQLLQKEAVPYELLSLVGLDWEAQVDKLLEDYRFSNLSSWHTTNKESKPVNRYKDWQISFCDGSEVDISKNDCTWFAQISKLPDIKGNGDIVKYCQGAIDHVESTLAKLTECLKPEPQISFADQAIEEAEQVAKGKSSVDLPNTAETPESVNQNSTAKPEPQISFQVGDRVRVTLDPNHLGREGVVVVARPFTTTVRFQDGSENTWGNGGLELVEESIAKPELQISFPDLESLDLPQLEQTIAQLHSQADEALETSIAAAKSETLLRRYEGLALIAVKQKLGHGEWEPWLAEFAKGRGVGDRQIRIYIQLARNWQDEFAELPLNGAIEQIRKAKRLQRAEQLAFLPDGDEPKPQAEEIAVGAVVYHKGFSGEVTQLDGDRAVFKFDDGEYRPVSVQELELTPLAVNHDRTCSLCQFCEVVTENSWYCQHFSEYYIPDENPAPKCERFATEAPKPRVEPNPIEEISPVQRKASVSPAQRAIEAIILECSKKHPGISFPDLVRVLLGWCGEDELQAIGQWIQQRLRRDAA